MPQVFKKELYFERYFRSMNVREKAKGLRRAMRIRFRVNAKSLRKEQIADLFLKHLSKKRVDGPEAILLNFLDDKNIYYDAQSLEEALSLLLEKKLIKEVPNTMAAVGYFDDSELAVPGAWIGSVEGVIKQSEITLKGKYFIKKGQKLDLVGLAEAKANREKWKERLITLGIALFTAVCVTLLTEPIKHFFAEHKKAEKESINESSPVRPRLDPRQRPEPRKPAGAVAPRS